MIDRQPENGHGSQGEPDEVTWSRRKRIQNSSGQICIGGRIVGFGGRTVAEQVDPDHRTTGILEEISESASSPGGFERASPTVDEDDGVLHIGQDSP